ncbi:MAG: hypothetical protein ACRC1K_16105, partial [Planctomycetia bacterium]
MTASRFPFLIAVAALAAVPSWSASADYVVTVAAGKTSVPPTPVSIVLPADLVGKTLTLTDADGASTPVQLEDGKAWFVAAPMKVGGKADYTLSAAASEAVAAGRGVQVVKTDAGYDVRIDGALFTTYRTNGGPKPYCWPIVGPTGEP